MRRLCSFFVPHSPPQRHHPNPIGADLTSGKADPQAKQLREFGHSLRHIAAILPFVPSNPSDVIYDFASISAKDSRAITMPAKLRSPRNTPSGRVKSAPNTRTLEIAW